jgi:hypothetical protein
MVALGLFACGHAKPKNSQPPQPSPSPAPRGDLLRLKATPGEQPRAKVLMLIENESAGPKGAMRKVSLHFSFTEEEKVDAVSPDGAAQISARLVDVSGQANSGADQQQVDDFALALDELKIQFRRTPRGEVAAVTMSGVRKPLDDKQARTILNALYDAGRGAILPEDFVDAGATWKVQTQAPTSSGAPADATYSYTYTSKDGGVAVIAGEGMLESKTTGGANSKRMTVKSVNEYHLEIASGRLVSKTSDVLTQVEDTQAAQPGIKLRVKVGWNLQEAPK